MKPNRQIRNLEAQLISKGFVFDYEDQWERIDSAGGDELRLFRYAEVGSNRVAITASKVTGYWLVEVLNSSHQTNILDKTP